MQPWNEKDNGNICDYDDIWKNYLEDKKSVKISGPYDINEKTFGEGDGPDKDEKEKFKLKLGHINVFPWVLEALGKYGYLYKIKIELKNKALGMHNIWWVTEQDYHEVKNKPNWWNLVQHVKDFNAGAFKMPRPFKKELKEYDADVAKSENIRAAIYHPVYITTKPQLNIGHITDVHLDSRIDVYGQSEASVIEVEENCPPKPDGDSRKIDFKKFHVSIKDKIANFNNIFTNICLQLRAKGADTIVITGDLVDYNRGLHTEQTYRKCFTAISKVWEQLGSEVAKEESYRDDRNWFLFYKKVLELYDRGAEAIPIFTILGNHDYVNYGMAPWPLGGLLWDGVFDQNLTLYESALCFGENYNGNKAFRKDLDEQTDFVEWYTIFINPFADFVVEYEDQSMLMVDWGVKSNVLGPGSKSFIAPVVPFYDGAGGLHHARNLFTNKSDYIKNYSIYKSWLKSEKIKMLFMHATAICPRDDISIGQINNDLEWTDNRLQYGSFDNRRDEIIKDVEDGKLNMIISGHSHRNVVMHVSNTHSGKAKVYGAGEALGSIKHQSKNIVMVTSSGGPLPKYISGGPKICGCPEQYRHGWDFDNSIFYYYTYDTRKEETDPEKHLCTRCRMPAKEMVNKKAKRHRPGGNLLKFDINAESPEDSSTPLVIIESVPATDSFIKPDKLKTLVITNCNPRKGVMCDENKVFTGSMKLVDIGRYRDYKFWKKKIPIGIESRQSFKRYGYMDFPNKVNYVTFLKETKDAEGIEIKGLRGEDDYEVYERTFVNNIAKVTQEIGKDELKFLMRAASRDSDFAFIRYLFGNETWDREIKINKEYKYVAGHDKGAFNPLKKDPFKNLIIIFIKKPDLEKRKEICGY